MKSKSTDKISLAEKKQIQQEFINKHRKIFDILLVAGIIEDNTLAFMINRSKKTINRFKNELKKEPYSELIDICPYSRIVTYFRLTQKGYRACGVDRKTKKITSTSLRESEDLVLRYYVQQQEDKELKTEILEFINKYIESELILSYEMKELVGLKLYKTYYFKYLNDEQKDFFRNNEAATIAMKSQIENQFITAKDIVELKRNQGISDSDKVNLSDIFKYISIRKVEETKDELNIHVDYVQEYKHLNDSKIANTSELIIILFEFLKCYEFRGWHPDYTSSEENFFETGYELDSPKKLMNIKLSIYSNRTHDKRHIKRVLMHHNRHYTAHSFVNRGTEELIIEKKKKDKNNRTYTKKLMAYQMDSYFINLFNKDIDLYLFTNQGPILYQEN